MQEGFRRWNCKPSGLGDVAEDFQVPRPERVTCLLVGSGDVTWRVHSDWQDRSPKALEGLPEELGKRGEACWGTTDDREHEREAVSRGANNRLRASAHPDPYREGSGFGVRHDILVFERRASLALPRDRSALE